MNGKDNMWKRGGKGRGRRFLAGLLSLVLAAGFLGGCGDGGGTGSETGEGPASQGETGTNQGGRTDTQEEAGDGSAAMGRYVETAVDISEYTSRSYGLTLLSDGSFLILDESAGQLISKDGGGTWETVPIPGIPSMSDFTEENYIFSMAAAPDGTVAVLASKRLDSPDADFLPQLHVAGADGTVYTMEELPVPAEEIYVYNVFYSPEGELFATVVGSGTVYRVDVESGTLTKALSLEWRPDLVKFQGDYMLFLTSREGVSIYDRKEEKWLEDDVLNDFLEKNYLQEYYANETYTVYMTPGEENVLYIAGKGGLYRHVVGGSAMEQIIDGGLSSFSNPSMGIISVTAFGENEFAVLFSGGRVALYKYDPNIPTVPEDLVTVYSLEEENAVRQAIAQFQTENPDIFVKYEIGMSGTDGVSREDAVKKLNTELMAGKGPDVLILDNLPAKSYSEKGILADLKPHIDSLTGEAALLPNIVDAFSEEGKVYMVPVSFSLPFLEGRQEDIEGITDYASLADTVERLRAENPGAEISRFFSGEAAVRWFLPVAATAFMEGSGDIKEETLSEYLALTDRIYKAANEGLTESQREKYENIRINYMAESWAYQNFNNVAQQTSDFFLDDMILATGMLDNVYGYQETLSLKYCEGLEDVDVKSFDGMSERVFEPSVLVGLNASSAHQKEAEAFFDTIMGTEVQSLLYDGFMVNEAALTEQLSPEWRVMKNGGMNVDYGEVSSSVSGSTGDGREYHLDIYMPTREEYQALFDLCCSLKTPYVADPVVENAVIEIGAQYLDGYLTLDEAVEKIMARVEIYMAE